MRNRSKEKKLYYQNNKEKIKLRNKNRKQKMTVKETNSQIRGLALNNTVGDINNMNKEMPLKHNYKTSLQNKYTLGAFVQLKSDPETMQFFMNNEELMDEIQYIVGMSDLNEWEKRVSTGKYFYVVNIKPETQSLQFAIIDLPSLLKLQDAVGKRVLH